jgi:hypothetical protein
MEAIANTPAVLTPRGRMDVGDAMDCVRADAARLHVDFDRICPLRIRRAALLVFGVDQKRSYVRIREFFPSTSTMTSMKSRRKSSGRSSNLRSAD